MKRSYLAVIITAAIAQPAIADDSIEKIEIKGHNPLSTELQDQDVILGQRQSLTSEDLGLSPQRSLTDIMRQQFTSVNLNDVQNNPFQPDVQYRGFTASPLLGLPQGLSLYLNGVRFNEPFGDTVNWDLVPLDALDNVQLFSGSNPVFGQNTLGGALSLNTKTGFSHTTTNVSLTGGQYGSKELTVQSGVNNGTWAGYVMASKYEEDGWRRFSPSEVQQLFTSVSYRNDSGQVDINYLTTDNTLVGNGAIPLEILEYEGRDTVFTSPDQTSNELDFVSIVTHFELTEDLEFHGNFFIRENTTSSINGDDSDYGACQFADGRITLCELEDDDDDDDHDDVAHDDDDDDDLPLVDGDEVEAVEFIGYDDLALSEISSIDPSTLDGTYNTGQAQNESWGFTGQFTYNHELIGMPSVTIVGATQQRGDIHYRADTQFGILDNDDAQGTRSVQSTELMDEEARVRLDVDTNHRSLYVSNTTQINSKLKLNIAGRFNHDHILMEDLIDDGEGSLDGDHTFAQFNPAIGMSYQVNDDTVMNLSWAQSSRVPSPAELSCADENDPCRLPNGFVADPPLDQVVTRTIEFNVNTQIANTEVDATLYHSDSIDDIIFQQAGSVASRGYFINIDKTSRQGLEFALTQRYENAKLTLAYNYLNATFESPFTSFGPQNPQGANRQVQPGDTIPGQPKHQVKVLGQYDINQDLRLGGEWLLASDQYYRGDEANENPTIAGYGIVNLYANYNVNDNLVLSVRANNVLDKEYFTFGTYGEADEVLEDIYPDIESPNFVGPAHPRMISVQVDYQF